MKKIFIIIPWFDPAFRAGGPVQSIVNMIREMRGMAEFYIFTSNQDVDGTQSENIVLDQWSNYDEHTKVWYQTDLKTFKNLKQQVKTILPDTVFIIGLFDYHYNVLPLLFLSHPSKIVSVRGMLHPGALSQKPLKKRVFLSLLKSTGIINGLKFHATDEGEKSHIQKVIGSQQRVIVADNFPKDVGSLVEKKLKQPEVLNLLTVGLISPMKNHLLILQSLQDCSYNIHYVIVGAVKDQYYWQECQKQIALLPSNIKVTHTGEVSPPLVSQFLQEADVFVMPSKSENYGHAIIEALLAGLPVVTSHHTPWNQLRENNAGINVNTDLSDLTNAINFYASMQNEDWLHWNEGARNYAISHVDKSAIINQYRSMFGINKS